MGSMEEALVKKMKMIRMERDRLEALRNAIDNQNKELDDAAVAEREKECLKHAAIEEREKECLKDTGNLKLLTYYRWFCETVGLVPETKEHRD